MVSTGVCSTRGVVVCCAWLAVLATVADGVVFRTRHAAKVKKKDRRQGFDATLGIYEFPSDVGVPMNSSLGRCALVGSGDILLDSDSGTEIDAHDTVIRCNRLPVQKYFKDVGKRTDVLFLNWMLWNQGLLQFMSGGNMSAIDAGKGGLFKAVVLRSNPGRPIDWASVAQTWGNLSFPVGHETELAAEAASSLVPRAPSSGLHALFAIGARCQQVDLYGFGGRGSVDGHTSMLTYNTGSYGANHPLTREHMILENISDGVFVQPATLPWAEGWMTKCQPDMVYPVDHLCGWRDVVLARFVAALKMYGKKELAPLDAAGEPAPTAQAAAAAQTSNTDQSGRPQQHSPEPLVVLQRPIENTALFDEVTQLSLNGMTPLEDEGRHLDSVDRRRTYADE